MDDLQVKAISIEDEEKLRRKALKNLAKEQKPTL